MKLEQAQEIAARVGKAREYGHFIDGEWVGAGSGDGIVLSNPATRASLGTIQAGGAAEVDRAVRAAHAAFPKWASSDPLYRQRIMLAMAERLRARAEEFVVMESLNNGATISETKHFVAHAIEQLEYWAGAGITIRGETVDFADTIGIIHREPLGVVAQIIPWNAPLIMAVQKLGPALAAGCTVVLKPAETACLSVLNFFEMVADLLPPGVVNVVTGYGQDVGEPLVSHRLVRKVTFTGSRATAQKVIQYASRNIIPQTMELGGKSANIVCPDADLQKAAQSAVMTTVGNSGEVCLAGSRVFVHDSVKEEFTTLFRTMLSHVKQGDPLSPDTHIGCQASLAQFEKVSGYLSLAREEGATIAAGGERASIAGLEDGLFIQPTILDNCRPDMRVMQEEIFGPVTGLIGWSDEDDLLRRVNDVEYGLGGAVWTNDLSRAHRIARQVEAGTVWVNCYYNMRLGLPVGGYKQSGFGRENTLDALNDYTHTKSVVLKL
nr:aldehyde dehydrogenase family protein [Sphingomonas sp. CDS-1]